MEKKPKVVILCGGRGTRLKEHTEFRPKPLVPVGGKPILWHIMKIYAHHGYNEFILCLGYKGELIKQYFMHERWLSDNFTLDMRTNGITLHSDGTSEDWKITFVDTGQETHTGGRIKAIEQYIHEDVFFCTYGDGVAPVNIPDQLAFHAEKGKLATLTAVHPYSKYGVLEVDQDHSIFSFIEKPLQKSWVNAGYFVLNRKVFDYIDEDQPFEKVALPNLSKDNQLVMYKFDGDWLCMDTYKDYLDLNKIWEAGAPWKIWK